MNKRDKTKAAGVVKILEAQHEIIQELANDATMREQNGRCSYAGDLQEAWQQMAQAIEHLRNAAKLPPKV
jgi:Mg2+ and Co2+ transporter CorA